MTSRSRGYLSCPDDEYGEIWKSFYFENFAWFVNNTLAGARYIFTVVELKVTGVILYENFYFFFAACWFHDDQVGMIAKVFKYFVCSNIAGNNEHSGILFAQSDSG